MRKYIFWFAALFSLTVSMPVYASTLPNNVQPESPKAISLQEWHQKTEGWYYYQDGHAKTGWLHDDGNWYYLDSTGLMKTGWMEINNVTYYFYPDGHMASGESFINGKIYTFSGDGTFLFAGIRREMLDDATITAAVELYHQNYDHIVDAYNHINADRNSRGLNTLELNQDMCIASMYRCLDMINRNYYAHFTNGIDHANEAFLGYTGTFVDISENLNKGTLKTTSYTHSQWIDFLHDGLMRSELHAMNILRPPYKRVGVGVVVLDDGKKCYLTQMFTDRTDF